jgi:hypothetical protein
MRSVIGRRSPALVIACLALFVALGGSVYAAKRINGHQIKVKSLPGNRLAPGSVPGNRLRPGAIPGGRIARDSITGAQIDTATLGRVPSAGHAEYADAAGNAETALHALSADSARTVNGYDAGCGEGLRIFASACWQVEAANVARNAPDAAAACADAGGELPSALALAAFAEEPGIELAPGDEWSGDVTNVSGGDVYGVVTVAASGEIDSVISTNTKRFRCVLPLVH